MSSSNVSLLFAWITGTATDPSFSQHDNGNAKSQTVSFLATTLARVIQLSTGAVTDDVDGWT